MLLEVMMVTGVSERPQQQTESVQQDVYLKDASVSGSCCSVNPTNILLYWLPVQSLSCMIRYAFQILLWILSHLFVFRKGSEARCCRFQKRCKYNFSLWFGLRSVKIKFNIKLYLSLRHTDYTPLTPAGYFYSEMKWNLEAIRQWPTLMWSR